jgi:hypothetical protein
MMMLEFNLMNDSDGPLDSSLKTWKLIIDDKEIKDSDMLFGNGPEPIGRLWNRTIRNDIPIRQRVVSSAIFS